MHGIVFFIRRGLFFGVFVFFLVTNAGADSHGTGIKLSPVADVDVYEYSYRNWNNCNWGGYPTMGAGYNPTGGERRVYMRFDVASAGQVQSATLKLHQYHKAGSASFKMGLFYVTSPWSEGRGVYHSGEVEPNAGSGEISWTNQPQINPEPAVVFDLPSVSGTDVEVDMTQMVQAWQSGTPNYGFLLKPAGPSPQAGEASYAFRTKESDDVKQRPVLLINGGGANVGPGNDPVATDITSIKLFDPVPKQNSAAFKSNTYPAVSIDTERWDQTPYHIQKQFSSTLVFHPGQKIYLSSNANAPAPIRVDNFLLFEVESNGCSTRFTVGSGDPFFYNGIPVPHLLPLGFTYPVDRDISGLFPKDVPVRLTVSALDYGGFGELSSVYLLVE